MTYPSVTVIDFEATCKQENPSNYRHEIIEFPVVVIDCSKKSIVSNMYFTLLLYFMYLPGLVIFVIDHGSLVDSIGVKVYRYIRAH